MTGSFEALGRGIVPAIETPVGRESGQFPAASSEAALIDLVVEMVLALEPLEHKQHASGDGDAMAPLDAPDPPSALEHADAPAAGSASAATLVAPTLVAPTLVAESTQRMLAQMRAVLDREAARLGVDGAEGKAAVDQVSLIARTLEKIDQIERLIAEDQARATARTLSADEREQLRQTVRQLILAAAERLAAERRVDEAGGDGVAEVADDVAQVPDAGGKHVSAARDKSPDPADAGSLDPGPGPG
ncbi:MAG: hypothetical protein Q8S27_17610 [Hoeflea sp.]|nr:hypothetical protein [Hoeflea sp.]